MSFLTPEYGAPWRLFAVVRVASVLACGLLLAVPASARVAQSADSSDPLAWIVGTWIRDERASDDLMQKVEELETVRPGGGFGRSRNSPGARSGQFGSRPSRGPGSVPGVPGAPDAEERELLQRIAEEVEVVRLEIAGDLLTITNASRQTRLIPLDERRVADGFGGEVRAFREGSSLVIESRSGSRLRRERLLLDEDMLRTGLLEWQMTLQGSGSGDIEFKTVYERVGDPPSVEPDQEPEIAQATIANGGDLEVDSAARSKTDQPSVNVTGGGSVLRLLPPEGRSRRILEGKVLFQTLIIDPTIATVEFLLDDEVVARRKFPPWESKLDLDSPARVQVVTARALSVNGSVLAEDRLTVNRLDPAFAVLIESLAPPSGTTGDRPWQLTTRISVPRDQALDKLDVFIGDSKIETIDEFELDPVRNVARVDTSVSVAGVPGQFVRVVAGLADGSTLEDAALLDDARAGTRQFSDKVNVELVELQVLVTDKAGRPVTEVAAEDFEVREGKTVREVAALYPAEDLPLVLGLAIDSSGSMAPIWRETTGASERFLNQTLRPEDRAFVVDFDTRLRLLEPLTGDKPKLVRSLSRLEPEGGTALYDSILFSLLQYGGQPGRRALVVLTDGFDVDSKADPKRAIEFGKRLGVPVYIIALATRDSGAAISRGVGGRPGATGVGGSGSSIAQSALNTLRVLTDPTGGRLFQVRSIDRIGWVFEQIEAELRSQFVLTYYSATDEESDREPKVKMLPKGLSARSSRVSER